MSTQSDFDKIQRQLLTNPVALKNAKERFEKSFGVNSNVRTKKQWQNLVRVYGIALVCEKEGLTESEVKLRCEESFQKRVLRVLK